MTGRQGGELDNEEDNHRDKSDNPDHPAALGWVFWHQFKFNQHISLAISSAMTGATPPRMTTKSRIAVTLAALALAAPALATETPVSGGVDVAPTSHLTCAAPTDAAAIDHMLAAARSPLAGDGRTIVDTASAVGLDPRAVVAIAAHETLLETYEPSRRIHNPFGLGPHWEFPGERAAIRTAVDVLDRYYLAEGRETAATIGPKWAPVGAENDPDQLNNHWVSGVSAYYESLGGDPGLPMTLQAQNPAPDCSAAERIEIDPNAAVIVTRWDPINVPDAGFRMSQGGDPTTGQAATPTAFAFPLALRDGEPASLTNPVTDDPTCNQNDADCAVTLTSAANTAVVAGISGELIVATEAEQTAGIGFWIQSSDGDRFGYSPLLEYAEGVRAGQIVAPGTTLGAGTGTLLLAWERDSSRINPYPLLKATLAGRNI